LYDHLKLTPNASLKEIHAAFRRQALKWHPKRNESSNGDKSAPLVASRHFADICESYEVLSDARLRVLYDRFGLEALREGVPGLNSSLLPFKAHHPQTTFKSFFGTDNPFESFFHDYGLTFSDGRNQSPAHQFNQDFGPRIADLKRKRPEVVQTLYVSLSDLYMGREMRVSIETSSASDTAQSPDTQKTLTFRIEPGLNTGSKIRFEKQINETHNHQAADIVFVIEEKPHERYRREGNNLVYTAEIDLVDALTGGFVEITTLDQRQLRVPINDIISPHSRKIVKNEGMPIRGAQQRGDLHVVFDIRFPSTLSPLQKRDLRATLEESSS